MSAAEIAALDPVWALFVVYEELILEAAQYNAMGDPEIEAECYQECVLKFPRIVELWDVNRASLRTAITIQTRWHAFKSRNRFIAKRNRNSFAISYDSSVDADFEIEDAALSKENVRAIDAHVELAELRRKLGDPIRQSYLEMLELYYCERFTYEELAGHFNTTKVTIRNWLLDALNECRALLGIPLDVNLGDMIDAEEFWRPDGYISPTRRNHRKRNHAAAKQRRIESATIKNHAD